MIRRIVSMLALVAGSILLTLLVRETELRARGYEPLQISRDPVGWAEPDLELGWKNRQGSFRSTEPGHAMMSFGPDGRRIDPVGPKDTPKILLVGDSFAQGEGVADDEPYPHVINRALPTFEVLNFGTGGYGTYQSLLRVRSYFRVPHPPTPLVIYGFMGHHLERNIASGDWISALTMRDGRYVLPPHARFSNGRLTEFPGGPVDAWPAETRSAAVTDLHQLVMHRLRRARYGEHVAVLYALLQQMKDTVGENRASLVVIGLMAVPQVVVDWMRQAGVDYIDCQHPAFMNPAFPGGMDPALRVGGVGHPSARLHAWWGECGLKALADRGYTVPAGAAAEPVN